jgi:hypothetical protein
MQPLGGSLGKPLGTQEFVLLFQYQPSPQPSARFTAGEMITSEANPTLATANALDADRPILRFVIP